MFAIGWLLRKSPVVMCKGFVGGRVSSSQFYGFLFNSCAGGSHATASKPFWTYALIPLVLNPIRKHSMGPLFCMLTDVNRFWWRIGWKRRGRCFANRRHTLFTDEKIFKAGNLTTGIRKAFCSDLCSSANSPVFTLGFPSLRWIALTVRWTYGLWSA